MGWTRLGLFVRTIFAIVGVFIGNVTLLFVAASLVVAPPEWWTTGMWLSPKPVLDLLQPHLVRGFLLVGCVITIVQYVTTVWAHASAGKHQPYITDPGMESVEERVRRLAHQLDIPMPDVEVKSYGEPNSYTIGRSGNATLVVTRALIEELNDDQLTAVLAHELAHIKNHDVGPMTLATAYLRTGTRILDYGQNAIRGALGFAVIGVIGVVIGVISEPENVDVAIEGIQMGLAIAAWLSGAALTVFAIMWLSKYVPESLSQYREFAADRTAVKLTGDPEALASALATLDGATPADEDLRSVGAREGLCLLPRTEPADGVSGIIQTFRAAYKASPHSQDLDRDMYLDPDVIVGGLVRFHPPTEQRIERLQAMRADGNIVEPETL